MSEMRWVACSGVEHGPVGYVSHLAFPGTRQTACGASASHPEIWRGCNTKPRCKECMKASEARP